MNLKSFPAGADTNRMSKSDDAPQWFTEMRRGLPRPIVNDLPVPYTSAVDKHADVHDDRSDECREGNLCGVCGLLVDPTVAAERGYYWGVAVRFPTDEDYVELVESLVMHRRCLRLTMVHCPHMRMNGTYYWRKKGPIDNYPIWIKPNELGPEGTLLKPLSEREVQRRAKITDPGHAARQEQPQNPA